MQPDTEMKIARARLLGLIRAIAGAENRAAAARAKGRDAGALDREVAALRAELERVEALAQGVLTAAVKTQAAPPVHQDLNPENEDAGAAAEEALAARRPRPGGAHLQDLAVVLAEEGAELRLPAPEAALLPFRRPAPAVTWLAPP